MNKVSIIKDAVRNFPHAIAVEHEDGFIVKGITEFGKEIVSDIVSKNQYQSKSLPTGFISTEFKNVSEPVEKLIHDLKINEEIQNAKKLVESVSNNQRKLIFQGRSKQFSKAKKSSPSGVALYKFGTFGEKITMVDFKAKKFMSAQKRSSNYTRLKNNKNIKINKKTGQLVANKLNTFAAFSIEKIISSLGQKQLVRQITDMKVESYESLSRRANRRASSLSVVEASTEKIDNVGQRISSSLKIKLDKKI